MDTLHPAQGAGERSPRSNKCPKEPPLVWRRVLCLPLAILPAPVLCRRAVRERGARAGRKNRTCSRWEKLTDWALVGMNEWMSDQVLQLTFILTHRPWGKFQKGKRERNCHGRDPEKLGIKNFMITNGSLWLLSPLDSAPVQRPVGCFFLRARGHVCSVFWSWGGRGAWPNSTHNTLPPTVLATDLLEDPAKDVSYGRFNQ